MCQNDSVTTNRQIHNVKLDLTFGLNVKVLIKLPQYDFIQSSHLKSLGNRKPCLFPC